MISPEAGEANTKKARTTTGTAAPHRNKVLQVAEAETGRHDQTSESESEDDDEPWCVDETFHEWQGGGSGEQSQNDPVDDDADPRGQSHQEYHRQRHHQWEDDGQQQGESEDVEGDRLMCGEESQIA